MTSIATFPVAPTWADASTAVSDVERSNIGDGYRTYERPTLELPRAGWLTGPDDTLGPHSDVTVGVGRTDSDAGCVIGEGVFVQLRGDESIYFKPETARAVASALLEAAAVASGQVIERTNLGLADGVRERVSQILADRGHGESWLADASELSLEYFAAGMCGRRVLDLEDVEVFADALGIEPVELMPVFAREEGDK